MKDNLTHLEIFADIISDILNTKLDTDGTHYRVSSKEYFVSCMANILYYYCGIHDSLISKYINSTNDKSNVNFDDILECLKKHSNHLVTLGLKLSLLEELKSLDDLVKNEPCIFTDNSLNILKDQLRIIYSETSTQNEHKEAYKNIIKLPEVLDEAKFNQIRKYLSILRNISSNATVGFILKNKPLEKLSYNIISNNIKYNLHKLYAQEYRLNVGIRTHKTTGNEVFYRGLKSPTTYQDHIGKEVFCYYYTSNLSNSKFQGGDACHATSTTIDLLRANYYALEGYILDIRPPAGTEVVNLMEYHKNYNQDIRYENKEVTFDVIKLSWIKAVYKLDLIKNSSTGINKKEISIVYENPFFTPASNNADYPLALIRQDVKEHQCDISYGNEKVHVYTHYPIDPAHQEALRTKWLSALYNEDGTQKPSLDKPYVEINGEMKRIENYDASIIIQRRNEYITKLKADLAKNNIDIPGLVINTRIPNEENNVNIPQQQPKAQQQNGDKKMSKVRVYGDGNFGCNIHLSVIFPNTDENPKYLNDIAGQIEQEAYKPDQCAALLQAMAKDHSNIQFHFLSYRAEDDDKAADFISLVKSAPNQINAIVLFAESHYQSLILDKRNSDLKLYYFDSATSIIGDESNRLPAIAGYLNRSEFKDNYNLVFNDLFRAQGDNQDECGPMAIQFLTKMLEKIKQENFAGYTTNADYVTALKAAMGIDENQADCIAESQSTFRNAQKALLSSDKHKKDFLNKDSSIEFKEIQEFIDEMKPTIEPKAEEPKAAPQPAPAADPKVEDKKDVDPAQPAAPEAAQPEANPANGTQAAPAAPAPKADPAAGTAQPDPSKAKTNNSGQDASKTDPAPADDKLNPPAPTKKLGVSLLSTAIYAASYVGTALLINNIQCSRLVKVCLNLVIDLAINFVTSKTIKSNSPTPKFTNKVAQTVCDNFAPRIWKEVVNQPQQNKQKTV